MTQQEINEGNALIANSPFAPDWARTKLTQEMAFHRDWSWIMPVVTEIKNCDPLPDLSFAGMVKSVTESRVTIDVEDLFQLVVEFIVWYNQSKQQ